MGRRSNHSREELQAMVINAASEIVATEGIRELSTRKIVAKIGYTVGTLYHFFKNLDDIIIHVNAKTLDILYQRLEQYKNIKEFAYEYLNFGKDHLPQWQLLFEYTMPENMEYPAWYEEKIIRLFTLLEGCLADIDIPEKNRPRTARVLWSGVHGICALYHTGKLEKSRSDTPEKLVDDFIKYYLAGIKAEK